MIQALYRRPRTTKPEPGDKIAASRSRDRTRSGPWTSAGWRNHHGGNDEQLRGPKPRGPLNCHRLTKGLDRRIS